MSKNDYFENIDNLKLTYCYFDIINKNLRLFVNEPLISGYSSIICHNLHFALNNFITVIGEKFTNKSRSLI